MSIATLAATYIHRKRGRNSCEAHHCRIKRRWPMISCLSKTHRLRSWKHMGSALSREHIQFRLDGQIVDSIRIDTELHFRVKWLIVQCSQGRLELSSQTHKPWMHSSKVIMNRDISRPIPRRSNNQVRLLNSGVLFTTALHELHLPIVNVRIPVWDCPPLHIWPVIIGVRIGMLSVSFKLVIFPQFKFASSHSSR